MNKAYLCTKNITEQSFCVSLELDFPSCHATIHCVKGLDSVGASDFLSINTTGAENQFCEIQISVFPHQCFPLFDHRNLRRQLSCFSEKSLPLLIWYFKEKDIFLHFLVYFKMQHLYSNNEGLESSDVNIFPP